MACLVCPSSPFRALAKAAAKSAAARLRRLGALPTAVNWADRARICESCPLRVVRHGVSYCGRPFLERIARDPATDGCGCPCHGKARSPEEHCPLNTRNRPATRSDTSCDCKWCVTRPDE